MEKSPKFIDLFCGAGGLSKGLINSGFQILWAIDYDKKCKPRARGGLHQMRALKTRNDK